MTEEEIHAMLAVMDGVTPVTLKPAAFERIIHQRDEARRERDALRAKNERLRTVLSQIALYTDKPECFEVADMANAALREKP